MEVGEVIWRREGEVIWRREGEVIWRREGGRGHVGGGRKREREGSVWDGKREATRWSLWREEGKDQLSLVATIPLRYSVTVVWIT